MPDQTPCLSQASDEAAFLHWLLRLKDGESPELEPWLPYFGVHPGIIISESTTWKLSRGLPAVFLFWSGQ